MAIGTLLGSSSHGRTGLSLVDMDNGAGRREIVQNAAGTLQSDDFHTRDGTSPRLDAQPFQTALPSPNSWQPSAEQPSWSPLLPIPIPTHRPLYPGPSTVAKTQFAEGRPGSSPINHSTISSRSASSPPFPNVQGNGAAEHRQLPRLKTMVTQNTAPGGRDASPLINELGRSPRKENRELPSSMPVSASSDSSHESPSGHRDVPAVRGGHQTHGDEFCPRARKLGCSTIDHPRVRPTVARQRAATTSHSLAPDLSVPLRPSNSIPDYKSVELAPVRCRNHHAPLRQYKRYREQDVYVQGMDYSGYPPDTSPRYDRYDQEQLRTSFRSGVTTGSSLWGNSSCTERDSDGTTASSMGDIAILSPDGIEEKDGGMSVDEAIGMYERGFQDDEEEDEAEQVDESDGMDDDVDGSPETPSDSQLEVDDRRQEPAWIDTTRTVSGKSQDHKPPSLQGSQLSELLDGQHVGPNTPNSVPRQQTLLLPRDRYGFRKETQYITVAQYDAWNAAYTQTLERRRRKWITLMKEHRLSTQSPVSFPPRSTKLKRFVRKGIPPEWRGAAWFWYAGGSAYLAEHPRLYDDLVDHAEKGGINRNDREMIERDLNRTFPDNIRFKPDPTISYDTAGNAGGGGSEMKDSPQAHYFDTEHCETPILKSLRRVLQAFSIHNPKIGYCQSLNFLAGLLLLFMSEEKTFWMLNIITGIYLPGTHSINLEGANVDLAVLMASIEESLPTIWSKINDCPPHPPTNGRTRLPTISLCTTSWFMSCFIGTLPIESVLRVWDSFFYEGSKTLFRIALTIFKLGEAEIRAVNDPMEVFLVVQTIPRRLVDAGSLIEACFKRRNGFGHLSQRKVDERRRRWRRFLAAEARIAGGRDAGIDAPPRATATTTTTTNHPTTITATATQKGRSRLNRMMTMNARKDPSR